LKFPLRAYRSPTPVPSLNGGYIHYRPVIPITVVGPQGQVTTFVLVDSGADDVVFPADLAPQIGVDLSAAVQRQAQGMGAPQPASLLFAPVLLELSDQNETSRWRAVVAFTQTPLRFSLFGVAGGIEHFLTTIDLGGREITLLPQPSLPATQDPRP
jgi:hypothetical protein